MSKVSMIFLTVFNNNVLNAEIDFFIMIASGIPVRVVLTITILSSASSHVFTEDILIRVLEFTGND